MAQDFESMLKDIFGEPLNKLTQFQGEQIKRLTTKLQDIAREAVKDEMTKLQTEVAELRTRLERMEAERAEAAADTTNF